MVTYYHKWQGQHSFEILKSNGMQLCACEIIEVMGEPLMFVTEDKILVHFGEKEIRVYRLRDEEIVMIHQERSSWGDFLQEEVLLDSIDRFLDRLTNYVGAVDNTRVRLYATGMFQKFSQLEQDQLVIHVFVNHGLLLNIIQPELEQFYKDNSLSHFASSDTMRGLIHQEFRSVVICGSFQQHLDDIGNIMAILQKHNILVLSPWTTKIVPSTLGTDFILLEGQEPLKNKRDAWKHKYIHMNKFRRSDAIIVCNPDGVIGKGTMFEFGFMVALSKRIIFTEKPKDLSIPFPYEVGLNFK